MEIRVSTRDVQQFDGDALAVGIFSDKGPLHGPAAALDEALAGVIADLRASGEVTGAADEVTLLHTLGKIEPSRVAIIGLGPRDRCTLERIRRASAIACRRLRKVKAQRVGLALASAERSINLAQAARAMTEGALLGLYEFGQYKSAKSGGNAASDDESASASASRPSASVLRISMVLPFAARRISPGRYALPPGIFSVVGTMPVTLVFGLSRPIAIIAPTTAAPPHISIFIASISAPGLSEMPPVSKVMPLPTSASPGSPRARPR